MKKGIATVSISGNLREKLEAIAAAGYDGLEIFEQDFIADEGSPAEVGRLIRDKGLDILLFQPFRDFEGLPKALKARAFERAKRKFELMNQLGCDLVLVCSSCHPDALGGIDRAADDFRELGDIAADHGVRVGYEALAWGRHVSDHRDAWEIVRRADHASIGLILDSFHTLGRGTDPDTIRRIPGDRIFFVQLADAPNIPMDLLYWSRHFRNMPGEGDLDVTAFMRAVMATGYSGPISLEIFNDQFRGGSPKRIARDGYASLVALMDDVARAEPELVLTESRIAPRQSVDGVAFVEFASRGREAERLAALLATLGFAKTGEHISKAIDLWQQGDIRIVVNRETGDYAGTSFNARGTAVCDIGLTVPSAQACLARAEALGSEAFHQKPAAGQLDIPAVRGLGGSVLHFLDASHAKVWETEFRASATGPDGAGLTAVDHVAQTMSYDQMLSWSLFYTSLFDMAKTPMIDVVDPDGLVRSQALRARESGVSFTLNGAETHRTLAGGYLSESFGAPVQHLALSTRDIFDTAELLAECGFRPLKMPQNYYDDLASRFDLETAMLERMRNASILYDRDADGAFFQLYSEPFAGGMFFEIVQRTGQYRGYGGPNAPFRIAAQKRLMRPKGMPRLKSG